MHATYTFFSITGDPSVLFLELFSTAEFRKRFERNNIHLKKFFLWVCQTHFEPASKLMIIWMENEIWLQGRGMNQSIFSSMFQSSEL